MNEVIQVDKGKLIACRQIHMPLQIVSQAVCSVCLQLFVVDDAWVQELSHPSDRTQSMDEKATVDLKCATSLTFSQARISVISTAVQYNCFM